MPVDLDLPPGCEICHGRPHIVSPHGGAMRCTCPRGRQLYELDQERKTQRASGNLPTAQRAARGRRKVPKDTAKAAANDKELP
jgi:hypothetical protein